MTDNDASVRAKSSAFIKRLGWKPVKHAAFRQMNHFNSLLAVYSLSSGKRYERKKDETSRKVATFNCQGCRKGRIRLQIQRRNATVYYWIVRKIIPCECGVPSDLMADLKLHDLSLLKGKHVSNMVDWRPLASACFPAGYTCDSSKSVRHWFISCKTTNCNGEINIERLYTKTGYGAFHVLSATNCSEECQQAHDTTTNVLARQKKKSDTACMVCYEDELDEYFDLCEKGHTVCRACLQGLVDSCPPELKKSPTLVQFQPGTNPDHYWQCPSCRKHYTPQTKIAHYYWSGDRRYDPPNTQKIEVHKLVIIPYGFQSFSANLPAHIATASDYRDMEKEQYTAYLHRRQQDAIRESGRAAARTPHRVRRFALRDSDTVRRLQALRRSGVFVQHHHAVLNFIDAIEDLFDRNEDGGFLQQVAGAHTDLQRIRLMQRAYVTGWGGEGNISAALIVSLLERKGLVEVIDLIGGSESDDENSEEE